MKKIINTQTYFRKILTMCLLVISVTIFVLTFFFYQKYSTVLTNKLYEDQEKNLEKSARTMNDIYNEISQLHNTVILDSKVVGFSSLETFNPAANYATYLIVKKYYNINPYVNSLYLYNKMANDAITCGSFRFDLEYSWEHLSQEKNAIVFPTTLKDTTSQVLTFAFPVYADSYDQLSGGLFINLNMEALKEHVLDNGAESGIILDKNGHILLSSHTNTYELEDMLPEVWNWVCEFTEPSGNKRLHIDGKEYLFTAYKEPIHEFTIISGVPYSEIVLPLQKQRNLLLTVAFIIFFTAIFLQYLITKRLYRPLDELTQDLRNSKFAKAEDMDEFSLIRYVYQNALDEIQILEERNAIYQPKMKADLLKSLILGNHDVTYSKNELAKNHWEIPFNGMFLCCFLIEFLQEKQLMVPLLQTKIQQLLHEQLGERLYLECISISSDQVVCLINTKQNSELSFDDLIHMLEEIRDLIIEKLNTSITISFDGVIMEAEDCSEIYYHAMELINYRFVLGYNQVIYQKRVMELLPEAMTYPDKLADEIIHSMVQGKETDFKEQLQELTSILRQYTYHPASLLFNRLLLDVLSQVQKLKTPDKNSFPPIQTLVFPKTLEEGIHLLITIYYQYQQRKQAAESLKDNKHFEKIEESKHYIIANYHDCNLSAGMVADYLGYSTNYFSRIFKSITGFYINDYIRQIRIVKAQELLSESDLTITVIATKTGFSNPNYFYSLFKKETGLTPAAYRDVSKT